MTQMTQHSFNSDAHTQHKHTHKHRVYVQLYMYKQVTVHCMVRGCDVGMPTTRLCTHRYLQQHVQVKYHCLGTYRIYPGSNKCRVLNESQGALPKYKG